MSIIAWLVVGVIAGWLANMVMRNGAGGLVGDLVLGVLGALAGGYIMGLITGIDYTTGINIPTILVAAAGAIVLIALFRLISGNRMRN
jgi:uncharacterized membrane protein YeaQ/YmgE (transglycosylase-associated protein family)